MSSPSPPMAAPGLGPASMSRTALVRLAPFGFGSWARGGGLSGWLLGAWVGGGGGGVRRRVPPGPRQERAGRAPPPGLRARAAPAGPAASERGDLDRPRRGFLAGPRADARVAARGRA